MGTPYEADILAWSIEQAALLRSRRLAELDFENIAGEIDDVGSSVERGLSRRFEVLIRHLLNWAYQPARRGNSWYRTIKIQRRSIARILRNIPSLRHVPNDPEWLAQAWDDALVQAYKETRLTDFPDQPIWTSGQILDPEFFPD